MIKIMVHLVTIESEYESAARLGYNVLDHWPDVSEHDDDVVIRWGNSSLGYRNYGYEDFTNVINPSKAIKLNVNKSASLGILNGVVLTPKRWRSGEIVPAKTKIVYRPIQHSGGSDFSVKKPITPLLVEDGMYATQWLDTPTELRVWFVGNRTMCALRKALPSQTIGKNPCRSTWGYWFKYATPPSLQADTLLAARAIELDVGAADVLMYQDRYYFLELNSAPTIDKLVIETFFKEGLRELIASKYPKLT